MTEKLQLSINSRSNFTKSDVLTFTEKQDCLETFSNHAGSHDLQVLQKLMELTSIFQV